MKNLRKFITQYIHIGLLSKFNCCASSLAVAGRQYLIDLLPFYAILRSIPNKLLGVLAMFGSLLILLILPLTDLSRLRGSKFRPFYKLANWIFFSMFILLMWIGAQHPEEPFVQIGQIATAYYFAHFLVIVPIIGIIENTLIDINYIN